VPSGFDEKVECVDPGPNLSGDRIHPVGQRFAEHNDVRLRVVVLHGPHSAGAVEAHLDFVIDHQDPLRATDRGKALEEAARRNDIAAGSLDCLHEEGAELRVSGLRVPSAGVLVLEQTLQFLDAIALDL